MLIDSCLLSGCGVTSVVGVTVETKLPKATFHFVSNVSKMQMLSFILFF